MKPYWVITMHDGYVSFRTDSDYTGSQPNAAIPGFKGGRQSPGVAFAKAAGLTRGQYEILDDRTKGTIVAKRNPSGGVRIVHNNNEVIMAKRAAYSKFDTAVKEYVYNNPDDEIGSVDELGWYGNFSGKIKGRGPFYAIVNETSDGFVYIAFYKSKAEMLEKWAYIESDYSEYDEELNNDY